MPDGEAMVTDVAPELMPTQPMSIAFGPEVVTLGSVAAVLEAPEAIAGAPSIGWLGLTPT